VGDLVKENHQDCVTLQMDLNKLALWGSTWGMQYHPQKCNSLSITRSHQPHAFNYTLKGHVLESVNTAKYLGITLSSNMSWDTHINNITAKANKILSFLRRNLQIKQEETKSLAYKSMVRSNLEYCSSIWAPHTKQHIDKIESVQRRAARYVAKRYRNTSSGTSMLIATKLCVILYNIVTLLMFLLFSSVFQFRWLSIDVTLLVL
jgi:hypothetical protein